MLSLWLRALFKTMMRREATLYEVFPAANSLGPGNE